MLLQCQFAHYALPDQPSANERIDTNLKIDVALSRPVFLVRSGFMRL